MELIQYFVFSCGCKAFITMDMFRAETSDVIRTLTENFAEVSLATCSWLLPVFFFLFSMFICTIIILKNWGASWGGGGRGQGVRLSEVCIFAQAY